MKRMIVLYVACCVLGVVVGLALATEVAGKEMPRRMWWGWIGCRLAVAGVGPEAAKPDGATCPPCGENGVESTPAAAVQAVGTEHSAAAGSGATAKPKRVIYYGRTGTRCQRCTGP